MTSARSRFATLAAAACLATGCGKMGNPLPPLRPVPVAVRSFTIERAAPRVTLSFTVPDSNADGSTPPKIDGVEIYALTQNAAAPAPTVVQLAVPPYRLVRLDVRRADEPSKGTADARPLAGGEATYVETVDPPASASPMVRYYAVAGMVGNRRGAPSRVLAVQLAPPKSAPADLSVDYTEQSWTLKWTPASPEDRFHIEEVDQAGAKVRRLTPEPVAAGQFTAPVEIGKPRCFAVRAVEGGNGVVSVGAASPPKCATPVDRFPPAPPTGLNPFPGEGGIDLVWTSSTSSDVAGYIVLRGDGPDGTLRPLMTEPINATQFRDQSARSGATYSYQVVAVDTATPPNRSEPSARVTVTARLSGWRPGR